MIVAVCAVALLTGWRSTVAETSNCPEVPISQEQIVETIEADLIAAPPEQTQDTRYITLANLVNSCATPEQMQLYRHAVVKLLNSLSWAPRPAPVEMIGPDGAIIRLRLSALGWTAGEWKKLLQIYPYGLSSKSKTPLAIAKLTGSPLPYLRADWFAHTAARPPHYYRLLKLPRTFKALQEQLGPEVAGRIQSYWGRRSGYTATKADGRVRLASKISYSDQLPDKDAASASSDNQLTASGLPTSINVRRVPRQTAATSLFTLPNGFRAYFVHHATGPRLKSSPLHPCQVCNFAGLTVEPDGADGQQTVSGGTLKVSGLYPVRSEMQAAIHQDEDKWNLAMKAAGIDPALVSYAGLEPIRALGERFANEPLTIATAAAELGMQSDVFEKNMLEAGNVAFHTARVLAQQTMPRNLFQARFKVIAEAATDMTVMRNQKVGRYVSLGSSVARSNWRRRRSGSFGLSVVSGKSAYRLGDLLHLSVRPQISCNLTLIGVGLDGSGVVIFPNRFNQETYVPGGKIVAVPGKSASYKLRLRDKGTEKIISFCNADTRWSGVNHDFGKKPFTVIDDVKEFLKHRDAYAAKRKKTSYFGLPPLIASSVITFTVE